MRSNPTTPSRTLDGGRLASIVATGFGAGLVPFAPGTLGAVEGLVLFMGLAIAAQRLPPHRLAWAVAVAAIDLFVFAIGVLSAGTVARLLATADPSRVVIDEINGQMISLSPALFQPRWTNFLAGFILFRALDIFKPYPVNRLEALPGGWGIMADDVAAGVIAAVLLWCLMFLGLV